MAGQNALNNQDNAVLAGDPTGQTFSSPLLGLSAGLLQASEPSTKPQTLGGGLGRGFGMAAEMQRQATNALRPSGDVANAMYVESLRQRFGENDPRYQAAKRAHDLQLESRESLMGYRDILGQTAPYRATSPEGRILAEAQGRGALDVTDSRGGSRARVGVGRDHIAPTAEDAQTQQEQLPDKPDASTDARRNFYDKDTADYYKNILLKKSSDTDTRKRNLYAQNIDKTLSVTDIKDLTKYSGLDGRAQFLKDSATAAVPGNEVPESLKKYYDTLSNVKFLSHQIRQFYGDSIQPLAMDRINKLTDPTTWWKNPEIAESQFNQLKQILEMETQTYKKYEDTAQSLVKPQIKLQGNNFVIEEPGQKDIKNMTDAELQQIISGAG